MASARLFPTVPTSPTRPRGTAITAYKGQTEFEDLRSAMSQRVIHNANMVLRSVSSGPPINGARDPCYLDWEPYGVEVCARNEDNTPNHR